MLKLVPQPALARPETDPHFSKSSETNKTWLQGRLLGVWLQVVLFQNACADFGEGADFLTSPQMQTNRKNNLDQC